MTMKEEQDWLKEFTGNLKKIGIGIVGLLLIPTSVVTNGYAFMKLWAWFMAKTFDLPTLNLPQAIGVAMCVHFLTPLEGRDTKDKPLSETVTRLAAIAFIKPTVVLLFALIVRHYL
jgi:hypothetical protein